MENKIEEVEVSFEFEPIKKITKLLPKFKVGEYQSFVSSKIKVGKNNSEIVFCDYNKNEFVRQKNNDLQKKVYKLDLNKMIEDLLDYNQRISSSYLFPYIPSFEVDIEEDEIGSGGFGILKKCKFKRDDKVYAFKHFKENLDLDTFNKEVSIYSKISHPSIPKFIGVSFDINYGKGFFIEFIDGKTLKDSIKAIEEKDKLNYIYQLFDAFSHLHHNLIVHRDLNPNNVMIKNKLKLTDEARLYIIDYGISKCYNENTENTTSLFSRNSITNNVYRDQSSDKAYQNASYDIWSLGCLVYFIYTGKAPCDGNVISLKNKFDSKNPFFKKDEFNDQLIYEVIKDCCSYNPQERKTAEFVRNKIFKRIHSEEMKGLFNI